MERSTPRLVLYSDQVNPTTRRIDAQLLDLIGKANPKVGFLPANADPTRQYYRACATYYQPLGVNLAPYFELDLRYQPDLLPELLACDAIHLSGGNTFYFLKWLKTRRLDKTLRSYTADGGVLVGVSAGAILMTPDAEPGEICGDRQIGGVDNWEAMHLVNFHFIPHLNRFPDAEKLLRDYSVRKQARVYGCPDDAGLVVRGREIQPIGEIHCWENGRRVDLD
jgi:dipeptidase E